VQLGLLGARRTGPAAFLHGRHAQSLRQRHRTPAEVGNDLLQPHFAKAATGHPDDVLTEFPGIRLGRGSIHSALPIEQDRSDVTHPYSRPAGWTGASVSPSRLQARRRCHGRLPFQATGKVDRLFPIVPTVLVIFLYA
jgi:hypothetical protein